MDENGLNRPSKRVWKAFESQGKVREMSVKGQGILKRILSGNPERPRRTWIPDIYSVCFCFHNSPAQWRVSPIMELFMPLLV